MDNLRPAPLSNVSNRRRFRARALGAAGAGVALGIAGCSKPQPSLDLPGTTIWAGLGFPALSGMVSIHSGLPGVIFGPMGQPGSANAPRYAMLVKYPSTNLSIGGHGGGYGGGRNGVSADLHDNSYIYINQKKVNYQYSERVDLSSRNVLSELLTVDDVPINFGAGNLLLIDLSKADAPLQQVNVVMPHETYENDPKIIAANAANFVSDLKRKYPVVEQFLQ